MNKSHRSAHLIVFLLTLFATPNSHALVHFALVGDATSTTVDNQSAHHLYDPNYNGYGGGMLLTVGAGHSGIQFGALYKQQQIETRYITTVNTAGNITTPMISYEYTRKVIEVPLMYRLSFLKIFSLGVGGFYAKVLSVGGVVYGPLRSVPLDGLKHDDEGVSGSFAIEIPLGGLTHLLLDGRYNHGFTKVGTREATALAGFSWGA